VEVFTSLPGLILLAFILATIGPGLENLLTWMVLAFLLPRCVRFVRNWWATSSTSTLGQRLASIVLGTLLLGAGLAAITLATFGFLGLGVQPPEPDLGAMLQQGMQFLQVAPHTLLRSGQALFFSTVGWFLLADTLLSHFRLYRREAWLELNR
jgi:ABC-type dipeptide/oligopeptide/nickel transport system permease subunit